MRLNYLLTIVPRPRDMPPLETMLRLLSTDWALEALGLTPTQTVVLVGLARDAIDARDAQDARDALRGA
jgi:hypothetical protein